MVLVFQTLSSPFHICYRYMLENRELSHKVEVAEHKVILKEQEILDHDNKLVEENRKFQIQQNRLDGAKKERRAFSKQLNEAENEILEMRHAEKQHKEEILELRQKIKEMNHAAKQRNEDIAMKEGQLARDKIALQKSEKEKTHLKREVNKTNAELKSLKEQNAALDVKERNLQKSLQDAHEERQNLKRELEETMKEKDMLGTQMVRRNDELSLLQERERVLESRVQQGDIQYQERLEDVRLLKIEVKKLRHEKNVQTCNIANTTDMRRQILNLERDVTRERSKCRALEEELQTQTNVHRWRVLEGTDPPTYDLIQKNQVLQKRLLAISETLSQREAQLQDSQNLCQNLKDRLSRQPGPDVALRLQEAQHALREKEKKIKLEQKEKDKA
ncbi:cilia- and flagella-associated protein 58-like [Periplaneta americana]|uniref:cilia- and flagella-associated protein 58-like n=1 Tax=Periplaneta americana TaxID=6978 RepID=UPI0037E8078B